jgi:hypothetical protein
MAATERNSDILQCKENLKHYDTHTQNTQTRPKPLDFSDVKILRMPSFGGEVK